MLISAKNDPIHTPDIIPWPQIKSNPNIIYIHTPRGAHLEFMVNRGRNRWYKKVMTKFLNLVDEMEEDNLVTE
jgi:predicted alpha/beta-fold hydrolase